jgi:hypothetical protein
MRRSRRNSIWRPFRRKLCAAVTLCAYVLTTLGFPLPAAARKAGGDNSSCCQSVCGCPDEQRERHQCCCSHPAPLPEPRQTTPPKKSCCETPAVPEDEPGCDSPCCRKHSPQDSPTPQTEPDEEEPETSQEEPDGAPAPEPAPGKGPRWVLGIAAMQCQGQSTLWVSAGAALPPSAPLSWSPGLDRIGWLSFSSVFALVLSPDPPAPPPRLSQV